MMNFASLHAQATRSFSSTLPRRHTTSGDVDAFIASLDDHEPGERRLRLTRASGSPEMGSMCCQGSSTEGERILRSRFQNLTTSHPQLHDPADSVNKIWAKSVGYSKCFF